MTTYATARASALRAAEPTESRPALIQPATRDRLLAAINRDEAAYQREAAHRAKPFQR